MISFGFQDGISQPQIEGLDPEPKGKEPKAVKPGYALLTFVFGHLTDMLIAGVYFRLILCRHEGDKMNQPKWAADGSFLVFRDLQQLVPEFDK